MILRPYQNDTVASVLAEIMKAQNPLIVAPHSLPPRLAAANDWVLPPGWWITIVTLDTPYPASVTTAVMSVCDPIVAPFAG